jgi:CDP-2,3-bis-(O-geranylgeranyl)-sn-glycerol synthase
MNMLVQLILETIWLLLPAGVANIAPVVVAKLNWFSPLNRPMNAQLLGPNKTWRGLVLGLLFGSITGFLLGHGAVIGAALGAGALAGDAAKSFFKRRLHIAPGKAWPVFDQIDFVIGALFVASIFFSLTLLHILTAIIIFGSLSWLSSLIGLKLKIKSSL